MLLSYNKRSGPKAGPIWIYLNFRDLFRLLIKLSSEKYLIVLTIWLVYEFSLSYHETTCTCSIIVIHWIPLSVLHRIKNHISFLRYRLILIRLQCIRKILFEAAFIASLICSTVMSLPLTTALRLLLILLELELSVQNRLIFRLVLE